MIGKDQVAGHGMAVEELEGESVYKFIDGV